MKQFKIFISLLFLLSMVFIGSAAAVDIPSSVNPEMTAQKSKGSPMVVIGNKDTKRYHLPGMPYYHQVKEYHRVYFSSEQEAIDLGYYKAGTGKDLTGRVVSPVEKTSEQPIPEKPITAASTAERHFNYKIIIAVFFFLLFFALPFLPAVLEIIRKRDSDPLFIEMDYNKDPRYFCKSFKQLIQKSVSGLPLGSQMNEVMLSKKEDIRMTESLQISSGTKINNLLYVHGDMVSDAKVNLNKEVYVTGSAHIGPDNYLHVLAAEGNISIAERTVFDRWLDSNGNLDVGEKCRLGISASCEGELRLAGKCSFRRLYGMPVTTGHVRNVTKIYYPAAPSANLIDHPDSSFIRKTRGTIPEGSILKGNFVYLNDLHIGYNSVINGSIKCYGNITLDDHVTIFGNVFADGKITVGKEAIISGHVFSQNAIRISENSVIGRPGVIKSVLGKKSVSLAPSVTIYGYISTEGKGRVI